MKCYLFLIPIFLSTLFASEPIDEKIPKETPLPSHENNSCECNTCCQEPLTITLEYAINRALTANRQILSSINSLQSSNLRLELAYRDFDLKMRPNGKGGYSGGGTGGSGVDLGWGLTWDKKGIYGTKVYISPFLRRLEKETNINIDASITQPLLKGFNREYNLSSLRSAQFSARSAVRSLHSAQVNMVSKTISALYEVIKQEQLLEIQKEMYERLLTASKIVKLKEEKDLSDGSELVKIQTELQTAESALLATEMKLKESQDTVRELLVLDITQCFVLNLPMTYCPSELKCNEAVDIALRYRTEIEQSCDDFNEKIRLSKVAKENLKPDLDLVLKYNNSGYDRYFRDIDSKPKSTWTINLQSNTEFDRASEKVAYNQSLLTIESARTSVVQIKEKVTLEVKRAFRVLEKACDGIQFQEKKIKQLQGERKLIIRKYEKGQAKNSDIIQADKNISTANTTLLNAIIEHIIGEYNLKSAMGLLIEKPIVNC